MTIIDWADSAEKHCPIGDVKHALRYRVAFIPNYDEARDGSGETVHLVIGYARDGVTKLEVLLHPRVPNITYVFHAMRLRRKTWDRVIAIYNERRKEER